MWGKARKKPIVIEFRKPILKDYDLGRPFELVKTREGTLKAYEEDFIIKGVRGEIYPIGPSIFEQTYDIVEPIQSLQGSVSE